MLNRIGSQGFRPACWQAGVKVWRIPINRWGFSRRGEILFYNLPVQHTQLPF
jgi:hypothetical protein